MDLQIVELSAAQGQQLAALNTISFPADWGEQWSARDVISSLAMPGVRAHAAALKGDGRKTRLTGFLLSRYVLDEAEILLIGVDPQYRRNGIANMLIRQFLIDAQSQKISRVFLEVRETNKAALDLYLRAGFRRVGERKNYYKRKDGRTTSALTFEKYLVKD